MTARKVIRVRDVMKPEIDIVEGMMTVKEALTTMKHIDTKIWEFTRIFNREEIKIANRGDIYLGIYHGRVKAVDREAKGVLAYSLPELEEEIQQFPKLFTDDLMVMFKAYRAKMDAFIEKMKID